VRIDLDMADQWNLCCEMELPKTLSDHSIRDCLDKTLIKTVNKKG
jgi:hypothetical protein